MAENKNVGGLWCFDVLERLSAERAQVERHLAGCDECTKFGGEFGAVVRGLRAKLGAKDDAPADVARRLDEALSKR
jgi:anti-sigma factor RsiW